MGSALHNWVTTGEATMTPGPSITEGIGNSRVTENLAGTEIDDSVQVTDQAMVDMCYTLLRKDGWFFGSSSGINLAAAVAIARAIGARPYHRHQHCAMTAANISHACTILTFWRKKIYIYPAYKADRGLMAIRPHEPRAICLALTNSAQITQIGATSVSPQQLYQYISPRPGKAKP